MTFLLLNKRTTDSPSALKLAGALSGFVLRTAACAILLAFAQPLPPTLDQIKADANLEHRSAAAIEFALAAEKSAEAAYSKTDLEACNKSLHEMEEAAVIAQDALDASGKRASRNPKYYKLGEQKSREIIKRLEALEHKMDFAERKVLEAAKAKVTAIHDAWLEGIMSKTK